MADTTSPRSDWDRAPIWFKAGLHEIGVHEIGDNRGPDVARYCHLAHCKDEGDPWCAIWLNAMLELNGIPGTRDPSSQSFRHSPNFVRLSGPALGAIAVYWRKTPSSGLGHVNFYRGEQGDIVLGLGGNQHDGVNIAGFPRSSHSFGLIGYWWPAQQPLPVIGSIPLRPGTPLVISADKVT